jgi:hypothetical protein
MHRYGQSRLFGKGTSVTGAVNPNFLVDFPSPLLNRTMTLNVRLDMKGRYLARELGLNYAIRSKHMPGHGKEELVDVVEESAFDVAVPKQVKFRLYKPSSRHSPYTLITQLKYAGLCPVSWAMLLYFAAHFTPSDFPYKIIGLGTTIRIPGHTFHEYPVIEPPVDDSNNWRVDRIHIGRDSNRDNWLILAWSAP